MMTRFITIEVPLQTRPMQLQQVILTQLRQIGEPLRWAIVSVDSDRHIAQIEAVVTSNSDFPIPLTAITTI